MQEHTPKNNQQQIMEKEYVACLQISWSAYDFWITFFEKDLDHHISDLCRNNSKFSLFVVFSVRRSIEYRSLVKWNLRFHIKMWAVCSFVGLQRLASCNALFCLTFQTSWELLHFDMKTKRKDNVYKMLRIESAPTKRPVEEQDRSECFRGTNVLKCKHVVCAWNLQMGS